MENTQGHMANAMNIGRGEELGIHLRSINGINARSKTTVKEHAYF